MGVKSAYISTATPLIGLSRVTVSSKISCLIFYFRPYRLDFLLLKKLYGNIGFNGDKILYRNLDLIQGSPNKILFHFLWK